MRAFRKMVSCAANGVGGIRHEINLFTRDDILNYSHFVPHADKSGGLEENVLGTLFEHFEDRIVRREARRGRLALALVAASAFAVGFIVAVQVGA